MVGWLASPLCVRPVLSLPTLNNPPTNLVPFISEFLIIWDNYAVIKELRILILRLTAPKEVENAATSKAYIVGLVAIFAGLNMVSYLLYNFCYVAIK